MLARTSALSIIATVVGSFALFLSGCSSAPPIFKTDRPVKVAVSFPPLYSFVANVAGDRAEVRSICTTTGPHGYTFNTVDSYTFRGADVAFALGLGFDDRFIDKAVVNAGNPKLKGRVVKLGDRLVAGVEAKKLPKPLILYGECDHPDHKGQKHEHKDDIDAHMWSGVPQAKVFVAQIRDTLKEIDPDGAAEYDKNAADYLAKLDQLRADGREMLKDKKNREVVTFHASMGYFADTFDLTIPDTIRRIPTDSRTSKEFRDLVDKCRQLNVRTIAVEPQYPKEGEVHSLLKELNKGIAKGNEVTLIELDPLETAPAEALSAGWYEEKMRENLAVLKKGLP